METVGQLIKFFLRELMPLMDWAINHWAITLAALVALIFWASHGRLTQKKR